MLKILSYFKAPSVWLLILPAMLYLGYEDFELLETLLQWSAFALVLAGVSVVVSMVIFPQIKLTDLMDRTRKGDMAAAIVAGALLLFFGLLFYSMVFWAKA